jgi:hypothetical protein
MEETKTTVEVINETPTSPVITEREKIRAATNDPALASDQFQLGERAFPIVDLPYDDYLLFVSHLQPVIEAMVNKVAQKKGISLPGIDLRADFNTNLLLNMCGKTLPEMVCIMCRQSDPGMTVKEVKDLGRKPTVLAVAVMKQIKQNGIIKDFVDFFQHLMPLAKGISL